MNLASNILRFLKYHNCSRKAMERVQALGTTGISNNSKNVLQGVDDTQAALMREPCILIDRDDNRIGSVSKKDCHLLENINSGMMHRAFSVFLFNLDGQLLLQQRSDAKITFPGHYTNTCCSHPLHMEAEVDEDEAMGVKRAAQRRLQAELGIPPNQVPLDCINYLTRIHYKSENVPRDNTWGEHEVDYILFIHRNVDVTANINEVKNWKYFNQEELKQFIDQAEEKGILLTPWFKLITQKFLYTWWNDLNSLQKHMDHKTIHRMVD